MQASPRTPFVTGLTSVLVLVAVSLMLFFVLLAVFPKAGFHVILLFLALGIPGLRFIKKVAPRARNAPTKDAHTVQLTEESLLFESGTTRTKAQLALDEIRRTVLKVSSSKSGKLSIYARGRNLVIRAADPAALAELHADLEDEIRKRKFASAHPAQSHSGPKTAPIPPSRLRLRTQGSGVAEPSTAGVGDANAATEKVKEALKAVHEGGAAEIQEDEQGRWRSI